MLLEVSWKELSIKQFLDILIIYDCSGKAKQHVRSTTITLKSKNYSDALINNTIKDFHIVLIMVNNYKNVVHSKPDLNKILCYLIYE